MIKYNISKSRSSFKTEELPEGEKIETLVERIMTNKEPIKDGAPIIYMDRSEGVNPSYDIRTDRMEVALEAQDSIQRTMVARRDESAKIAKEEAEKSAKIHGTEQSDKTA